MKLVALGRKKMVALDLLSEVTEALEHVAVSFEKKGFSELDVVTAANIAGATGNFVQIVARHVRKHMVLDLKVQSTHKPIHQELSDHVGANYIA